MMWEMLSVDTAVFVLLGAAVGGFVNGLTGTGTAMAALPLWLQVLEPLIAVQVAGACSIAGQLLTIRSVWPTIDWRRLAPILGLGLVGVPLGVWGLSHVSVPVFKLCVGLVLVTNSTVMLIADGRIRLARGGGWADRAVGLIGGVFGGLAGLSGAPMAIWAALRGWTKLERRQIFQMFNLTILAAMLAANAGAGRLTAAALGMFALALPVTVVGVFAGAALYRRLSDRHFDRLVLWLLLAAGAGLVASNIVNFIR